MPKYSISRNFLPNVNYSQDHLLNIILKYIYVRAKENTDRSIWTPLYLPFGNAKGVCSGMVALWSYYIATDSEGKFASQLAYISKWKEKDFASKHSGNALQMEEIINNIFFLHHHVNIYSEVEAFEINKSLEVLMGDLEDKIAPAEYSVSFVFNKIELERLIRDCAYDRKILRFSNDLHTIGAYYRDGIYSFYDPNYRYGVRTTTDPAVVADLIFKSLAAFCRSKDYIALNLMVFDFVGKPVPTYVNQHEYYHRLMQNEKYKAAVLKHSNIMRVGLRFDLPMLEYLFSQGFKAHSLPRENPEIRDSIVEHDGRKVGFLLEHGVDVDTKMYSSGETAVNSAIHEKHMEMLFALLINGANPNLKSIYKMAPLEYALYERNTPACIILIAFNAEIAPKIKKKLDKKYSKADLDIIHKKANTIKQNIARIKASLESEGSKTLLFKSITKVSGNEPSNDTLFAKEILPYLKLR